jgi:hypothetical protein
LFKRQRKQAGEAGTDAGVETQEGDAPAKNDTEPESGDVGLKAPIVVPAVPQPQAATPPSAPEVKETPAPEVKAPEVKAPDVKAPEVKAPTPEVKAPEVKAPEVKAPAPASKPPEPEVKTFFEPEAPAPHPPAPDAPATPGAQPQAPGQVAPEVQAQVQQEIANETLPAALEPELRKIIDTAVARVASIELEAIRESRKLTQRTEEEGREALKLALDRSFQLVNSFELLTVTVAGMVSALRVELDSAVAALQQADDPYARLTPEQKRQAEQALPAPVAPKIEPPAPAPAAEAKAPATEAKAPATEAKAPVAEAKAPPAPPKPAAERPAAQAAEAPTEVQGMNGNGPEAYTQPSPEITEMFREQIVNMKNSGKTKEEAERTLLRFNLGRRFIGLLDEIYSDESPAPVATDGAPRGRFVRRFFSRN